MEVAVLAAITPSSNPWQYELHPEVWLLVTFLVGAYVYAIRVIGPRAVLPGQKVVTGKQIGCFIGAMTLLFTASSWPLHDIAEEYLYSAHMLQHMMLSYFMPPLALLATPEWLARLLVGRGRTHAVVSWLAKPVVAAVAFNAILMITHIPGMVTLAVENGSAHYTLHVLVVVSSLLMWMCVCGPLPELRISAGGQMIYLFSQSIVPTVPAGWLIFAEGTVYKVYDHDPRLWGISVTYDQQYAGLIMKVGGSIFLWTIVAYLFFFRFMAGWEQENSFKRTRRIPDAEIVGHSDEPALTYDDVAKVFDTVPPTPEPERP